ncbi:uncharacterized protein F4807DRAFT_364664 [Annulohypoxylon truncatum]|uniref:uncharacterized protein n=1 Tax=Annulohypoxylon truncatum TaxID=327061 RepID=UPI002008DDE6|nr:uncharacterized protein F4807DRAFT_364664 [Annulohypoxylon truncatum]KAI1212255.1 hypothetical protein F4807DRAFT_364664 [Annulohypoxylon truncatum]
MKIKSFPAQNVTEPENNIPTTTTSTIPGRDIMASDADKLNQSLQCISSSINEFAAKTESKFARVHDEMKSTDKRIDADLTQIRIVVRAEVDDLNREVAKMQKDVNKLQPHFDVVYSELQRLRQDMSQLTQVPQPRLPDPPKLLDSDSHLCPWLRQMVAKLRIDGDAIGSPEARFYYVYNFLSIGMQAAVLYVCSEADMLGEWDVKALLAAIIEISLPLNRVQRDYAQTMLHLL